MRGFSGRPIGASTRSAAMIAAGVLAISLVIVPTVIAAQPSSGTVTVDGHTGDWDLGADFFANMTPGGGAGGAVLAKLYLRYDCNDEVLYALVLMKDGEKAVQTDPTEAYIRIDGSGKAVHGNSGNNGTPPDFSWVNGDGEVADGWEASAPVPAGNHTVRAHIKRVDDTPDGYTSLDNIGVNAPMELVCEQPTQTPAPTGTVAPTQTPAPTGTVAPTQTPAPTGTVAPTQTPAPTGSVSPTSAPNTPAPTGDVAPATSRPVHTLPPTDTLASTSSGTNGAALILVALAVGSLATLVVTLGGRRRSLARVEVKETDKS
jgi:hypothetical protein